MQNNTFAYTLPVWLIRCDVPSKDICLAFFIKRFKTHFLFQYTMYEKLIFFCFYSTRNRMLTSAPIAKNSLEYCISSYKRCEVKKEFSLPSVKKSHIFISFSFLLYLYHVISTIQITLFWTRSFCLFFLIFCPDSNVFVFHFLLGTIETQITERSKENIFLSDKIKIITPCNDCHSTFPALC